MSQLENLPTTCLTRVTYNKVQTSITMEKGLKPAPSHELEILRDWTRRGYQYTVLLIRIRKDPKLFVR